MDYWRTLYSGQGEACQSDQCLAGLLLLFTKLAAATIASRGNGRARGETRATCSGRAKGKAKVKARAMGKW